MIHYTKKEIWETNDGLQFYTEGAASVHCQIENIAGEFSSGVQGDMTLRRHLHYLLLKFNITPKEQDHG